jgi:hypothetical protein
MTMWAQAWAQAWVPRGNEVFECLKKAGAPPRHHAGPPESHWYDTLGYAALLHNMAPTRALGDKTPEEAWSGNKPDTSRLSRFRLPGIRAHPGCASQQTNRQIVSMHVSGEHPK